MDGLRLPKLMGKVTPVFLWRNSLLSCAKNWHKIFPYVYLSMLVKRPPGPVWAKSDHCLFQLCYGLQRCILGVAPALCIVQICYLQSTELQLHTTAKTEQQLEWERRYVMGQARKFYPLVPSLVLYRNYLQKYKQPE